MALNQRQEDPPSCPHLTPTCELSHRKPAVPLNRESSHCEEGSPNPGQRASDWPRLTRGRASASVASAEGCRVAQAARQGEGESNDGLGVSLPLAHRKRLKPVVQSGRVALLWLLG
jgi:hypothetical protein